MSKSSSIFPQPSPSNPETQELEFYDNDQLAGFRLDSLEVFNWGTFDRQIWKFDVDGRNSLLTGDIGSGKSTLVDAITTLLVPPGKINYNKAAGAEHKERDLRSYVLGYYKSERNMEGTSAKPVALRDRNTYSVILAVFTNQGYSQTYSLAQVFWQKEATGQPARFYVTANTRLSIKDHLTNVGTDMTQLRKHLRNLSAPPHLVEVHDSFTQYAGTFRRHFGIKSDQALMLFHQTVSMKSVGNLTEFVRDHMLEPSEKTEQRIEALIHHYDDLNRAHQAILRAKEQIGRLEPLCKYLDTVDQLELEITNLRESRDSLKYAFAHINGELLKFKIQQLEKDQHSLTLKRKAMEEIRQQLQGERDSIKKSISDNGGDRLEHLKRESSSTEGEKIRRLRKFEEYNQLSRDLELEGAASPEGFVENNSLAKTKMDELNTLSNQIDNNITELSVEFRSLRDNQQDLSQEITSLKSRRSNIPSAQVDIRARLCNETKIPEDQLPFAGELITVTESAQEWQGTIERVLRNFGLSLLVPPEHYQRVSDWVDSTNLRGRLVYLRTQESEQTKNLTGLKEFYDQGGDPMTLLPRKLTFKPNHPLSPWVEQEIWNRFGYRCCTTMEEFRRSNLALSLSGQIKGSAVRHEKDDRFDLHDQSRYILGWTNLDKIRTLEKQLKKIEQKAGTLAQEIADLQGNREHLKSKRDGFVKLLAFQEYQELDWKPLAQRLDELTKEIRELQAASDILKTLQQQLSQVETDIRTNDQKITNLHGELSKISFQLEEHSHGLAQDRELLEKFEGDISQVMTKLTPIIIQVLGSAKAHATTTDAAESKVTVESTTDSPHASSKDITEATTTETDATQGMTTDATQTILQSKLITIANATNKQQQVREWLQYNIEKLDGRYKYHSVQAVKSMQDFRRDYPSETREADASIQAGPEYRAILARLQADDLPQFETKFKAMLNENAIIEIANFQAHLKTESEMIKDRVEKINQSLSSMEYNPGRYILLETIPTNDQEIRTFRQELRACTEGTVSGSEDSAFAEAKFLQVTRIIQRFRGREGYAEIDKRWTTKVTDVRNWFTFAASERWRETQEEFEHYTDSGGKSGGQKEKDRKSVV